MKTKLFLFLLTINLSIYSQYKKLESMVGNYYKVEFSYDTAGKYLKYEDFYINDDESSWDKDTESTVAYDDSNKITEEIFKTWNETEFINSDKISFLYDGNGNISSKTFYEWTDTNVWEQSDINTYTYNANNLVQEIITTFNKLEFNYDIDNNLITLLNYSWDDSINNWATQAFFKNEYNYDENNMISIVQYSFDENTSQWVNAYYKYDFSYDNSYSNQYLILPEANNFNRLSPLFFYDHKIDTLAISYWNNDSSTYNSNDTLIFNYSDFTANISENTINNIKVYPNPFNENITFNLNNFEIEKIEILDLNGRIIKTEFSNNTLNLSDIGSGIYLYKIYSENNLKTGKIMKK